MISHCLTWTPRSAVTTRLRQARAEPDHEEHEREEDRRRAAEPHFHLEERDAHEEPEEEIEERARRDAGAEGVFRHDRRESLRGDVGERDDDVDEGEPHEDEEEDLRGARHVLLHDLADRGRLVPHRRDEAREIVHAPDEDRAEEDPEERRQPAEPYSGENRPDDRARRGDRREMLAEEERRLRGDVVDAVLHLAGRGRPRIVEPEPARHDAAVREISRGEDDDRYENDDRDHGQALYRNGNLPEKAIFARMSPMIHGRALDDLDCSQPMKGACDMRIGWLGPSALPVHFPPLFFCRRRPSRSRIRFVSARGSRFPSRKGYAEVIVAPNPVEAALALGTWKAPKAGDVVVWPGRGEATWRPIAADSQGWFSDSVLAGCYVYCSGRDESDGP